MILRSHSSASYPATSSPDEDDCMPMHSTQSSQSSHSSSESFVMVSCKISRIPSNDSLDADENDLPVIGMGEVLRNNKLANCVDYMAYTGIHVSDIDEKSPTFLSTNYSSSHSFEIGQDNHTTRHALHVEFPSNNPFNANASSNVNDESAEFETLSHSHSIICDHWQTADEFDDDYDDGNDLNSDGDDDYNSDFTNDSHDSFGPLQMQSNQNFHWRLGHSASDDGDCAFSSPLPQPLRENTSTSTGTAPLRPRPRIDSIDYIAKKYPSLSNRDKSINTDPCPPSRSRSRSPLRRKLSLSIPKSPGLKYINTKSRQARQALNLKSRQARQALNQKSRQARTALRNSNVKPLVKLKQIHKAYRRKRETKSRIIVIPANHRLKILWDVATIVLTFVSAYIGHIYIRDRSTYEWDWFVLFSNVWYFVDVLLNFFTEHRTSDGKVMRSGREVWGRYLTTWFAIDALSILPWERMFLRPIIQAQKRRHFVVKWFFRSKAVVKVTRILKHRHFRAFGMMAKNTKKMGFGGKRLLQLIIKYVPKYVLFYRNMKTVIVIKTLRQIHFARKIARNLTSKDEEEDDEDILDDEDEVDYTKYEADDDALSLNCSGDSTFDGMDDDIFKDDDSINDFSDDDTISCTSSDETNSGTDYESCVDDYDYDIRFSNFHILGIRRRTQVLQVQGDDNNVDEL